MWGSFEVCGGYVVCGECVWYVWFEVCVGYCSVCGMRLSVCGVCGMSGMCVWGWWCVCGVCGLTCVWGVWYEGYVGERCMWRVCAICGMCGMRHVWGSVVCLWCMWFDVCVVCAVNNIYPAIL